MPLRNSCLEGVIGLTKLDEISAEFALGKEDLFAADRIGHRNHAERRSSPAIECCARILIRALTVPH
jgi:hypothetical protein